MTLIELLLANLVIIACAMLVLWLLSIPLRNASIVDIRRTSSLPGIALSGTRPLSPCATATAGHRLTRPTPSC
ncbi:MAG TPA: hypothetical protein VI339_00355 [Steroidobacteraceae bacterium]|nr:hypothetical protein [Steroidobacteraceae bacterium]